MPEIPTSPRVAIIGTGVAGLGCAWNLRHAARITLIEKNARPGGHTSTVDVREGGQDIPIDTGFIVFNRVTYPNLCRLFDELGVEAKPSEMSFSVQHLPSGLEYNGMGLNKVFAQRRNLANLRFLRLLRDIGRFFKTALATLENPEPLTVGEFAARNGLGEDFLRLYLVPMSSAVWSTDPHDILNFPVATLIRFFYNHGFLGVRTHHPWFTVRGGARTYVDKILAQVGSPVLAAEVTRVIESETGVEVRHADGQVGSYDFAVLACHADEALAVIERPSPLQQALLAPFRYQHNRATLHTWEEVMPKKRRAWASWNYRVMHEGAGGSTTHYWMNALQGVSQKRNYFVSLNSSGTIPPDRVIYETDYTHPVFTLEAIRAQARLPEINAPGDGRRLFFCGSYFRYGFHEDAYSSGLSLARTLRERLGAR